MGTTNICNNRERMMCADLHLNRYTKYYLLISRFLIVLIFELYRNYRKRKYDMGLGISEMLYLWLETSILVT